MTVARETFDFRLGVDGTTSLYVNGANVDDRLKSLGLTQDEITDAWDVPLSVIAVGMGVFIGVKELN